MKIRIGITAFLSMLLFSPESASGQGDWSRFEYTQVHMGVQARIVLYAPDTTTARTAAIAAFDRLAELDGIMSDYRRDSELMQLCARAGEGPVSVSRDLFYVLSVSARLAKESNGAFDVTIGPLVKLWREARRTATLPDSAALVNARRRSGSRLIQLDSTTQTVALLEHEMQLDLGGIAKGYAADEAIEALKQRGVSRALIEFGGDVVVSGAPPGSDGWRLTSFLADTSERAVLIEHAALSTSGDTEQFVEIAGTRYSHVLDPRTGIGLTSRAAATVIASAGIISDALATTISVLGEEKARTFLREYYPTVDARVQTISGDGD